MIRILPAIVGSLDRLVLAGRGAALAVMTGITSSSNASIQCNILRERVNRLFYKLEYLSNAQSTLSSLISKVRVLLGGMSGGAPLAPDDRNTSH